MLKANAESSGVLAGCTCDGLEALPSVRDFLRADLYKLSFKLYTEVMLLGKQTDFLRLLSVTTHLTSSNLQLVHGEPFSTTSHRTLRALQQQQAFDARRFIGRDVV